MGMTGATKLRTIVGLAEMTVAIELIVAAEGLEYRKPCRRAAASGRLMNSFADM
jgi:histidine ammonia-lyase